MARLLFRIGSWCARHAMRTVGVWLVLLALAGTAAVTLSKPLTADFQIPGSRFEQVLSELTGSIPQAAGASGTVVLTSPDGFSAAERRAISELTGQWAALEGVVAARDPFRTQAQLDATSEELREAEEQLAEGRAQVAQAQEQLGAAGQQLEQGAAQMEASRAELAQAEQALRASTQLAEASSGYRVVSQDGTTAIASIQFEASGGSLDPELTERVTELGDGLAAGNVDVDYSTELTQDLSSVVGPAEAVGLVVAGVVLLVMLGSIIAAGLPLLTALGGVGVGLAVAFALTQWVEMNSTTPALALMLGVAVGIDYSLFLLNRHRTQLRRGMGLVESIALANGTSGNAVAFAGMTVIIALVALTVTGIPFLSIMGLVAAGTVLVAVAVAVTLTPALMALAGKRVLRPSHRDAAPVAVHVHEDATKGWAAWVQRRPWPVILVVLAGVAALAYPTGALRLGLPDGSSEPAGSTAYQAYDKVRSAFGAGINGPIIGVANLQDPVPQGPTEQASESAQRIAQAPIASGLADIEGVARVVPFGISDDRRTLAFQVVPETGPNDEATAELVDQLTARGAELGQEVGADLGFTGQTVANIDISQQLTDALPFYLVLVVGLSIILLLVVFRSIVIPLLATAGFLLSLGVAFGAVVAVYQWGNLSSIFGVNEPGAILSFLPILLIGVLFGLAMDYQLFLVSAMRESHVHGEDARRAVVTGFNHSARVVTAAAIIMISVFGGFVFAELTMVRPIGLGLAIGVAADAFLVRMTLTPAVMSLLAERAWYLPAWLDRILPNVDVEGALLERQTQEQPEPARVS